MIMSKNGLWHVLISEAWKSREAEEHVEKSFKALVTPFQQSIEFHLQNLRLVVQQGRKCNMS